MLSHIHRFSSGIKRFTNLNFVQNFGSHISFTVLWELREHRFAWRYAKRISIFPVRQENPFAWPCPARQLNYRWWKRNTKRILIKILIK